jgi:methylthioribose-1-phosphate isomerase
MNRKAEKLRVKQSYSKSFGHSPTFRKIMEKWFWIKPQKKRVAHAVCEHGRVDYKALKVLAVKQANLVQDLGNAILAMEKNRTKEKLELENVKKDALERLNNQKATIMRLENELENAEDAVTQKDDEIRDLKDSIYLKREEVNKNAN